MSDQPSVLRSNLAALARREQARELGPGLVLQIFRLLKVTQFHAQGNMAVLQQTEQAAEAARQLEVRTDGPISILFAKSTVFVAGQLLKGSRSVYESALELGAMFAKHGLNEIVLEPGVEAADFRALATAWQSSPQSLAETPPSPRIRLARVDAEMISGDEGELDAEEQVVRAYASAIVVMRRVLADLAEGKFLLPHEAKRIAQRLVVLSEGDTPAFLGVTAMRGASHDEAGRAVNAAILAVAVARQITADLALLSRIAMAALLFGAGRAIVRDADDSAAGFRALGEDEERRLPAATAIALTAMARVGEPAMARTVIAFEAQWRRGRELLGDAYGGRRGLAVASLVVATVQRFDELLAHDPAAERFRTPDEALAILRQEAADETEDAVVSLLVGALGIFPTGATVELSTGERALVVETPSHPAQWTRPKVRVLTDARGTPLEAPIDHDLAKDPARHVARVIEIAEATTRRSSVPASSLVLPGIEPTAAGTLDKNPIVHLLVYALDQSLAGTLVLSDPVHGATEAALVFDRGRITKVVTTQSTGTRAERIAMVAASRVQTKYAFYAEVDLVGNRAAAEPDARPLATVLAAIRAAPDRDRAYAVIARLGARPLRLHPRADLGGFDLDPLESAFLDALRATPRTFADLAAVTDADVARNVTYALLVTRSLDLGAATTPLTVPR